MARRIPENRFEELVRGATEVFIARGYRLTQMSDVAEAIGVAKGTLYGYVESKDALLFLCLRCADEEGPIPVPNDLPLAAPAPGAMGLAVKTRLAEDILWPALESALERPRVDDVAGELTSVIGELFDLMAANRQGIKLLDRCMDHPELEHLWQSAGRERARSMLIRYLNLRIDSGGLRPVADVRLAARIVIETCATWAVHIHWDRAPETYDPEVVRENAIEFMVRALLP